MFIVPTEQQNIWSYWGQVSRGAKQSPKNPKAEKNSKSHFVLFFVFSPLKVSCAWAAMLTSTTGFKLCCVASQLLASRNPPYKTNRSCVPDCFLGKNKECRFRVVLNVDNAPITCAVLVSSHPMGRQTGPGPPSPALTITYWTVKSW